MPLPVASRPEGDSLDFLESPPFEYLPGRNLLSKSVHIDAAGSQRKTEEKAPVRPRAEFFSSSLWSSPEVGFNLCAAAHTRFPEITSKKSQLGLVLNHPGAGYQAYGD